jgi:S-formylglutathione hydrolase FrmB
MHLVAQDVGMSIVLWIVYQHGLSCRVALGYLTKAGLSRYVGQHNWVVLT